MADFHARRLLRQQRQKLAAGMPLAFPRAEHVDVSAYLGGVVGGPASQALGATRASWAKLLFACCTEHQVLAR